MSSPCGGCPPCCDKCVFSQDGERQKITSVVVSQKDYGCIKGHGAVVRSKDGRIGQERGMNFHPITDAGMEFLRSTGNELAVA